MSRFFEPDLTANPDSPFVRDASSKLVRRNYWMDMPDNTLVMVMTQGIGANLTNDEKRAHLIDLKRQHLIDQVCVQEILPPEVQNPTASAMTISTIIEAISVRYYGKSIVAPVQQPAKFHSVAPNKRILSQF